MIQGTNCIHKLCEAIAEIFCKIGLFPRNYNPFSRNYHQDIHRPVPPTIGGDLGGQGGDSPLKDFIEVRRYPFAPQYFKQNELYI